LKKFNIPTIFASLLPGGNQALLLSLKSGQCYLSLTIQTELMRRASRFGVVLGDAAPEAARSAIQASLQSLNDLIDDECAKTTFSDLLDYLHQEKNHCLYPTRTFA